ncbi:hypothetical protein CWI37_1183p0010 [Hamiltosporidium tvaerminnensis]|uniref:Uncharacterized protein n=1 Tax=Hamiltosporidium tvaerminnensis TaxID=1176355 RepID=A0A4V6MV98_9MICR|nr:hypothetical protein CWI37_1183p0010 [Hamiltosporidium tvaerminnensis]
MKMLRLHRIEYYDKAIFFLGDFLCFCFKTKIRPKQKKYLDPIVFKLIENIIKSEPTIVNMFLHRGELLDTHTKNAQLNRIKKYGLKELSIEQIANLLISLVKSYGGLFHRELAYQLHDALFIEPDYEDFGYFEYYMRFAFTETERKLFRELKSMWIHLSEWKHTVLTDLISANLDMYFPECLYFNKHNINTQIKLINYFNDFNFNDVPIVLIKKATFMFEKIMAKRK